MPSDGIGLAIAQAFAEANASKVILVSRTQERLNDASKTIKREHATVEIEARVCDCSDVPQIEALWTDLANDNVFVDVFVLGASATQPPKTLEEQISMINFNMIAHLHSFERFRKPTQPGETADMSDQSQLRHPALLYIPSGHIRGHESGLCRLSMSYG